MSHYLPNPAAVDDTTKRELARFSIDNARVAGFIMEQRQVLLEKCGAATDLVEIARFQGAQALLQEFTELVAASRKLMASR